MINFEYRPESYFDGTGPTALIAKLSYPESQWGEEICIFASPLDGKIFYEVVDFYGNEFKTNPETSDKVLNLQEIIILIETLEVSPDLEVGEINRTLKGIPVVESLHYKQLKIYFEEKRKHFGFLT
ncbi:MAG: UDP-glucuronosyltransferase [Cyclobacteriaceae bacterium]